MKSAPFIERPACGSFLQKLQLVHREQKTNKIVRFETPGTNLCGDWEGGHGIESCRPLWQCYEVRKMDKEAVLKAVLHMDEQGPSITTYRAVLKECAKRKNLAEARRLHTLLVQRGMDSHSSLGEHVVSMLIKCGGLEDAVEVFHRLPHRSAFSWTAIISGYSTADQGQEALRMYDCMIREGLQPNTYTLASLLKACGSRGDLEAGKRIHWDVLKYRD